MLWLIPLLCYVIFTEGECFVYHKVGSKWTDDTILFKFMIPTFLLLFGIAINFS